MQNTFPYLLSWGLLSPFILRFVAGAYFVSFGYKGLTSEWWNRFDFFDRNGLRPVSLFATGTAIIDLTAGILLMMGFATQIVSIAFAIVCLTAIFVKNHGESFPPRDIHIYIILFFIFVSLIISGAGFYAMDLPL
ncbi:MAG TPA: DoxX family protein [Candidatus Paceibacterota bacterium]